MRVLLDESLPRHLGRELVGYDVQTVAQQGWAGTKDRELLVIARQAGFEAFVTADQNLPYQLTLADSGLAVVIVVARTNRLVDLTPLVPGILRALATARPGQSLIVEE